MEKSTKTMWETLWDYDPNALVVLDKDMVIQLINPAFRKMFQLQDQEIIGEKIADLIDNIDDFEQVFEKNIEILGIEREYPKYDLFVKQVIFPISNQNIIACIMVDITKEKLQKKEMLKIKDQTAENVKRVVNKQMSVAQEIAGLLGETTAETKVSLLNLLDMLKED